MNQRAAILAATLGLFCLLAGQGTAAPARQVVPIRPIPPVGPSPITADCRYLFVVDTSVTMQRYADGLYRTAHRHIATGLGGRMQEGDVFTVWTYADAVLTREFPLNAWTAELNIALANRTYEYLATRKFAGKSNLRPVFAELGQALAISTNLTVILISDGTDVVVGTPFDRPINVTYGKRASELRTAKMPFVTALVTQRGEFTHWSVRGGLEDINLPMPVRNPFPLPVLAEVPPQPAPAPVPIASPPTPPVVVTPAPKPVTTNVVAAAVIRPPAPAVVTPPPVTATAPQTNSPPPKPAPAAPVPVPVVVSAPSPKAPAPASTRPPLVTLNTNRLPVPVPAVKLSDVPPPKPAPAAPPTPKTVTNTVAAVSPVPKAPVPPAPVKPPEPALAPPLINPVPKSAPTPLPAAPKPPAPSAPVPAKSTPPPAPPTPPVLVANAPKVAAVSPPPKPVVAPEPKPAPAPMIKPKETLILPAIPPAPQPVIPPALRQPKNLLEASNALAKVELLRPPTVVPTSSLPVRPLEARVIEPKPAPKTNPPVVATATKPLPVSAPSTPVLAVKPPTNAAVMLPPPPKAIAALAPPAPLIPTNVVASKASGNTASNAVVPTPAQESKAKGVMNPSASGAATNRVVTTNATAATIFPPAKPDGMVNGKSSQVAVVPGVGRSNASPISVQQPVVTVGVKTSSVTNRLAKPAGALAVASPRGKLGGLFYLGAAIVLLVLAGGIIAYLLRPQPNPSVISQSIEHTPESPPK